MRIGTSLYLPIQISTREMICGLQACIRTNDDAHVSRPGYDANCACRFCHSPDASPGTDSASKAHSVVEIHCSIGAEVMPGTVQ